MAPVDAAAIASIMNGGSGQEVESFDDAPKSNEELRAEMAKLKGGDDGEEDDGEFKDDAGKGEPSDGDKPRKISQVDKIDESKDEDDNEKQEKPKEKVEEKEDGDKEEVKERVQRTVRVKDEDGETVALSPEATIKVKVNGKSEFVSLKTLQERYSLSQAAEEKFQKSTVREKELTQKQEQFQSQYTEVTRHLAKVGEMLDNEKASPLAAMNYLVEMSGRNVYDYNKKVHDYMAGEVAKLSQMDEVEQALYWKDQELSYLKSNHAAKSSLETNTKAEKERIESIVRMRESQGVSQEQYDQSQSELARLGYRPEQITPQSIVEYAALKPHLDKADGLCAVYNEDLDSKQMDDLVIAVAETLRRYPKLDHDDVVRISAKNLGWDIESDDDLVNDINDKASKRAKTVVESPKKETKHAYESFDDL